MRCGSQSVELSQQTEFYCDHFSSLFFSKEKKNKAGTETALCAGLMKCPSPHWTKNRSAKNTNECTSVSRGGGMFVKDTAAPTMNLNTDAWNRQGSPSFLNLFFYLFLNRCQILMSSREGSLESRGRVSLPVRSSCSPLIWAAGRKQFLPLPSGPLPVHKAALSWNCEAVVLLVGANKVWKK